MTKIRWVGNAPACAQNTYITPSGVTANSTWSLTINGKTVRYFSAAGTMADVVAGLLAAATATGVPSEFQDMTWANQTAYLQATAVVAGQPFTLTGGTSAGGTLTVQNGLAAPTGLGSSSSTSGGTLPATTTFFYKVTAYNACGESLPSSEKTQATGAGGTNTVTITWLAVTGAVGYKVYGRASSGGELFIADAGGALTYTDTGSISPAGAIPTTNTSITSGPNDISVPSNYSTGVLPTTADDLSFDHSAVNALYNLQALSGITLNSLTIHSTYTGQIGLAEINSGQGGGGYVEYRPTYLQLPATTVNVGDGSGQGSGLVKLDSGSVATTLNVRNTGSSNDPTIEAMQWKGTGASNVVQVLKGSVAIAGYGNDLATVATLFVGFVSSQTGDATVRCGLGATLTTLNMEGGTVEVNSALTTVTKTGGNLTVKGLGAVGTITDDSGTTAYQSTGTLTTANIGTACTLDFTGDMQSKTVTHTNIAPGGSFLDPFRVVVLTNPIQPTGRCRLSQVTIDRGETGWTVG